MKFLILSINLLLTSLVFSQEEFTIKENGLYPKFTSLKIDRLTKSELYNKTLKWIEENEKNHKLSVVSKIENEIIVISSIKGNAVKLDKQYFNAKYRVSIDFDTEQYKFEPIKIQLKANSKYDMGWKDMDLNNGSMYFKKQKVIRYCGRKNTDQIQR